MQSLLLPFLDGIIDGPTQSLLAEAMLWTAVMLVYFHTFPPILRPVARKMHYWKLAKLREGIFCGNGQDDSLLIVLWGLHHFVAGSMMAYGVIYHDSVIWRHGYLLENGFELADAISCVMNLYPYRMDGVKAEIKAALVFHHSTGLLLAYPILTTELANNEHMQAIAMWLLLGGAVSCAVALFTYTRNFDTELPVVTTAYFMNLGFFLYCRLYQFPLHAWHLIQDVKAAANDDSSFGSLPASTILNMLYTGLVAMTIFNLGICSDLVPKAVRYAKRCFDGVTSIEVGAVPRSRDSVFAGRRASLMLQASRRSSALFATVMHFNAVDDIAAASDLPDDDLKALNQTIAQLNGKRKQI
jgi:hypothetical protein